MGVLRALTLIHFMSWDRMGVVYCFCCFLPPSAKIANYTLVSDLVDFSPVSEKFVKARLYLHSMLKVSKSLLFCRGKFSAIQEIKHKM